MIIITMVRVMSADIMARTMSAVTAKAMTMTTSAAAEMAADAVDMRRMP